MPEYLIEKTTTLNITVTAETEEAAIKEAKSVPSSSPKWKFDQSHMVVLWTQPSLAELKAAGFGQDTITSQ